ncbi:MAG: glycosyltransferase family 2 protein [Marinomonas sp.]|uniref:glycosyltransferase family 2 protein n=1 Tax=Marinomonas sp. TaxID=1904862 RepID=UPI003C729DA1
MNKEKAKVICLTPIKNEAWILHQFLSAASLWADHIIVADQMSDDGSREIAKKYPKVILIDNESKEFNEPERQRILIDEARKISGKKLLIALDADEFISANAFASQDWEDMLNADEGTVFKFRWPFIKPHFKQYWSGDEAKMPFAFMDDGSEHIGKKIHSTRIPLPDESVTKKVNDFVVMHYQFTDWKRMESKHRWYQCYERLEFPKKSAVSIFRMYTHMYRVNNKFIHDIPPSWFQGYLDNDININSVTIEGVYHWDQEVELMFAYHGEEKFNNIDLPNNDSLLLRYLRSTVSFDNVFIKLLDKLLIKFGF